MPKVQDIVRVLCLRESITLSFIKAGLAELVERFLNA